MAETVAKSREITWSQLCEEADPEMVREEREGAYAYQFSNGRRFKAAGTQEPAA